MFITLKATGKVKTYYALALEEVSGYRGRTQPDEIEE